MRTKKKIYFLLLITCRTKHIVSKPETIFTSSAHIFRSAVYYIIGKLRVANIPLPTATNNHKEALQFDI
ncbi:hypothetical protein MSTHT_0636 [Methanosarcina thermophila TM-1]|uniref:Uncharacterized protein n=1 Tax=Methanosarcina thermophila (strain ATCC 43570 / DSM 1825 / OCM 12 / VKM B-1830 / TM-1) TaxID=523844 RepID=A0A0E3H8I1_METTT|nr:hypothetical protein MSTHT_0636 [Methanosarcina thermophila TM-1]